MGEYGRIVGEGSRAGGGSGSGDITGQLMAAVSDAVDQVASQPPEILVAMAVVVVIGLVLLFRR